ncbi:pyridoxamine 5'-phosphate oxidase family protein [Kribbella sp. NPDC050820]|uniref:pyridoxamine 5'-phosphate oxidase family protein n=1 Tax=Kribbella sp. NPDC050820 TaxID=3155408 RepID=UPI0033F4005F
MKETAAEISELQELLDAAYQRSTEHLRSIITGSRQLDAEALVRVLTGMCTLNVATVTARGEPRISAVDGHFLHARWVFSTAGSAAKARHLRARPAASISYVDGERIGVFSHGDVEFLTPEHPDFAEIEAHLTKFYGSSPSSWGPDIVYCRLQPSWMVGYGDSAALLAEAEEKTAKKKKK